MFSEISALSQYSLGAIRDIKPVSFGLIHKTWKVESTNGAFILQKVNPIYGPSVMEDMGAVLTYLKSRGRTVMEIVRTRSGASFLQDAPGFWRVFTYISGSVFESLPSSDAAYEAGKLLGLYHRLLNDFHYEFKHKRSIKHNIPLLYDAYKKATAGHADPEVALLDSFIERMPELDLPSHLRKCVHHGDAKISNFIFQEREKPQAVAMVDFDDCGKNYNILHELGGFFRSTSWMNDPHTGASSFSLDYFSRALAGYAEGSRDFLTDEEWQLIPQVLELNLLQLTSRFVRDMFEDNYFTWDPAKYPSRRVHNLARAKEHIALYGDVTGKRDTLREIVNQIHGTTDKNFSFS